MKILAIIPARYPSSRLPGKPLIEIDGMTMISRVYHQVIKNQSITKTVVATDDQRIVDEITQHGGHAMMTSSSHHNGTERCAEVVSKLEESFDLIINVQGDEPYLDPRSIDDLIAVFVNPNASIGSLYYHLTDEKLYLDPNTIKVVFTNDQKALYFSRSPIPMIRDRNHMDWNTQKFYKHIGLYAFRPKALQQLVELPEGRLEFIENLEQLRWMEHGFEIHLNETNYLSKSIDTPEDLVWISQHLKNK
jgi:3-deoxy-manno-octulosonate cytidylyltransferase (CMP-KDO synthetase)